MIEIPKQIGTYKIFGKLGAGGYGQVFVGRDIKTLQNYAIKVSADHESTAKEYKILKTLSSLPEFMKVHEFGNFGEFDFIVMEFLGKNFQYKENDAILSLRTVASIGIEILDRIEKMHSFEIIHKDIKPSQFLLSSDRRKILLVDYGMATFYKEDGKHKSFKTRCNFKGSVMFASINNHMGFRQSRRDDLECLCYSLIYLLKGQLPWGVDSRIQGFKKWKMILNQKVNTKKDYLFQDVPPEFESFYKYTRRLLYDQVPNYSYLKSFLQKFITTEPLYSNFDWIQNPNIFNKVESHVEISGEKCVLHLKNIDGEFFSRRRNGKANICSIRQGNKSVTFKCNGQDLIGNDGSEASNDKLEGRREVTGDGSTESIGNSDVKPKKKRSKTSCRKHEHRGTKQRIKTCDKIIDIMKRNEGELSSQPVKSPTYILPDISIGPSDSLMSSNRDDEVGTPKANLPEFKDKFGVLKGRKEFIELKNMSGQDDKCCLF